MSSAHHHAEETTAGLEPETAAADVLMLVEKDVHRG
jgi:hypothetical protein